MGNLREIRTRIRAVKNIQHVTDAMQKIAATRLAKVKGCIFGLKVYSGKMEHMVRDLLGSMPEYHSGLLASTEGNNVIVFLMTGERGLCGSYNSEIFETLREFVATQAGKRLQFIVCGKKGVDALTHGGKEILAKYTGLSVANLGNTSKEICEKISAEYLAGNVAEVYSIYTEFVSTSTHKPRVRKMLPLEREPVFGADRYLHEPAPSVILDSLLPKSLRLRLWQDMLDSLASEDAARMIMMEFATHNADEMVDDLTLLANRMRQSAITKELADIVGNTESMVQ